MFKPGDLCIVIENIECYKIPFHNFHDYIHVVPGVIVLILAVKQYDLHTNYTIFIYGMLYAFTYTQSVDCLKVISEMQHD